MLGQSWVDSRIRGENARGKCGCRILGQERERKSAGNVRTSNNREREPGLAYVPPGAYISHRIALPTTPLGAIKVKYFALNMMCNIAV
jgi:hypothetical protein